MTPVAWLGIKAVREGNCAGEVRKRGGQLRHITSFSHPPEVAAESVTLLAASPSLSVGAHERALLHAPNCGPFWVPLRAASGVVLLRTATRIWKFRRKSGGVAQHMGRIGVAKLECRQKVIPPAPFATEPDDLRSGAIRVKRSPEGFNPQTSGSAASDCDRVGGTMLCPNPGSARQAGPVRGDPCFGFRADSGDSPPGGTRYTSPTLPKCPSDMIAEYMMQPVRT